ncbi:MAG: transposase [Mycobacterium sp.]|nr:transposase [Mycobacterium sp.]
MITLLLAAERHLVYIPARSVYHASGSYRGDGKSDAKDARSSPTKHGCAATYSRVLATSSRWSYAS